MSNLTSLLAYSDGDDDADDDSGIDGENIADDSSRGKHSSQQHNDQDYTTAKEKKCTSNREPR